MYYSVRSSIKRGHKYGAKAFSVCDLLILHAPFMSCIDADSGLPVSLWGELFSS